MGELDRPPPKNPRTFDPKKMCGARCKRTGEPCKNFKMPNGRCRLHFGKINMKGNRHAVKHGVYSKGLIDEDERVIAEELRTQTTNIDEEIVMLKLQLRRTYAEQAAWVRAHPDGGLQEDDGQRLPVVARDDEVGATLDAEGNEKKVRKSKLTRRKTDFSVEIRRYTKLLIDAVTRRAELEALLHSEDITERIARELREFSDEAQWDFEGGNEA